MTTTTKTRGPPKSYKKQMKMNIALQTKKKKATALWKRKRNQSSAIGIHMMIVSKARGPTKLYQNTQKQMKINIPLQMKKRRAISHRKRRRDQPSTIGVHVTTLTKTRGSTKEYQKQLQR